MARVFETKVHAKQGLQLGTSSTAGHVLVASDTNGNLALQALTKTFRTVHTFAMEPITTSVNPRFFMSLASGQTCNLVKVRRSIVSGTSATITINKNGAAAHASYTSFTATTTAADVTQTVATADNDLWELDVTAVSGSPVNLTVTLVFEHTI